MNDRRTDEDGHILVFVAVFLLFGLVVGGAGLGALEAGSHSSHTSGVVLLVIGGLMILAAVISGVIGIWSLGQADNWSRLNDD